MILRHHTLKLRHSLILIGEQTTTVLLALLES
jgi:hypothetical protein